MCAQRVRPLAPPGSLLKAARPARGQKTRKEDRARDADHLDAIRQCPCLNCGFDPCGEAAHVRMTAAGKPLPGMGRKPDDRWSVPLCHSCHMEQHRMGEAAFWTRLDLDPLVICRGLYKLSPLVEGMRALVFTARAMAGKA